MRKAIRSSLGRMKWLKYVIPLIFQKSCTDKVLCSISYLTEILTKRVFFRHFCKSVKGPVFTGLFGPFYALQMLDIAHFFGKYFPLSSYMFSYLSKCFNRSKSVWEQSYEGSNPSLCAIRKAKV